MNKFKSKANSNIFKNRFQKGLGVYICFACGKKTRDTGIGEGALNLCKDCYNEMEKENAENDNIKIIDLTPYGSRKIEEIHRAAYKAGDFI